MAKKPGTGKAVAIKTAPVALPFAPINWPASNTKLWPLKKIKPFPGNPRTHPPEQIQLLAELMKKWGVDQPIVVDEKGFILKGHGRYEAAILAGFEEFPVAQHIGLTEDEKTAMRIADNQVSLLSGWNRDLLRQQTVQLKQTGFEMKLLAFDQVSLNWMTTGDIVADPGAEWSGMPAFTQNDVRGFRSIVVHFKDQDGVDKFAKAVKLKITDKTKFLHYPETVIEPFVKYEGEKKK